MFRLRCILILSFFVFINLEVKPQANINPYSVNVDNLSDRKVEQLIAEAQKRGMTVDEALNYAKAYGATDEQISKFRERLRTGNIQTDDLYNSQESEFEETLSGKAQYKATEKNKQIFGFDFFNSENLSFTPAANIPVSDTYILGYGDEIIINVYGYAQQSYELQVQKNGALYIPQIGPVYVGGTSIASARSQIISKLKTIYGGMNGRRPNTFAEVSVGELKGININVIGEVNVPGTYTLSAGASAFNALYLAGGPNENGSFRQIDVIREGKIVHSIDVYKYLIDGDIRENAQLHDQDVVMIRPYINRIILDGEFKRIGLFEANQGETVSDIIRYAGGFTNKAYTHRLGLSRNNTRTKSFKDVPVEEFASTLLQNGDEITAGEIVEKYENRVSIEGAVYRPGNYEYISGMKLSELIKRVEGVTEDAFLERGLIVREGADLRPENLAFSVKKVILGDEDVILQNEDSVIISSIFDMTEDRTLTIAGDVRNPGTFEFADKMTVGDIIFLAGGFKENADISNIEISRRLSYDETNEVSKKLLHTFQIAVDRDLKLSDAGFILMPFDHVSVRQAPGYRPQGTVTVKGEVKSPGSYGISSKEERISDIILRAGNLTPEAYARGASIIRKRELSNAEYNAKLELAKQDTTYTGTANIKRVEYHNVGIHLEDILSDIGGEIDLIVKDGDEINIPSLLQTVNISGAVLNPVSLVFSKKMSLKQYINNSGGFSQKAKKNKVYVLYADGTASATRGFIFRSYPKIEPGSEIIVPERPEINHSEQASKWIGISTGLTSLVASIIAIVTLTK